MFLIALMTDLVAITVVAYCLYFRRHRRRDLLLALVALNVGVMAVTVALASIEVGLGLGIGLFGILSIIRLRSDQITQREIAYYFVSIVLGLLAGLHPNPPWVTPLLSALVIAVMFFLDHPRVANEYARTNMRLDSVVLDEAELRSHLGRMGFTDPKVEVVQVDLVRDTMDVDIRFRREPRRTEDGLRAIASGWATAGSGVKSAIPTLREAARALGGARRRASHMWRAVGERRELGSGRVREETGRVRQGAGR